MIFWHLFVCYIHCSSDSVQWAFPGTTHRWSGVPTMPCGRFFLVRMAQRNGAIGMWLQSCGFFRYAYADTFGVNFACHSMFTCISVCGMSLSHSFSGNGLYTTHKIYLKCSLNFCIPFYAKFLRFIPDGNNSHFIPFSCTFLCRRLIFHYRGCVSFSWFRIPSICWARFDICLAFPLIFSFYWTC